MKAPILMAAAMVLLCSMKPLFFNETIIISGETYSYEVVKKLMLVQAEVDGKKGYFLFDTGASHLTLNQNHFDDKKIVKNVGTSQNTLSGEQALHALKVDHFTWGNLTRTKLLAPIADLSALEKTLGRAPLLGLIGHNIVKDYTVFFNYAQQTITLAMNNHFQKQPTYALDFRLCGHLPVLETTVGTNRKMYLGLDSGASTNVLDESWKDQVQASTKSLRPIHFTGSSAGTKQASFAILNSLTIAEQLTLEHVGMLLTDFTRAQGNCFRVDGLVGIDLFLGKNIAIDYKNSRLHVWVEQGAGYQAVWF